MFTNKIYGLDFVPFVHCNRINFGALSHFCTANQLSQRKCHALHTQQEHTRASLSTVVLLLLLRGRKPIIQLEIVEFQIKVENYNLPVM